MTVFGSKSLPLYEHPLATGTIHAHFHRPCMSCKHKLTFGGLDVNGRTYSAVRMFVGTIPNGPSGDWKS